MANIVIEIPDNKLDVVKAWVQSRVSPATWASWTNADYAKYVDIYLTNILRSEIYRFQQSEWSKSFVFDDPLLVRSSISAYLSGSV